MTTPALRTDLTGDTPSADLHHRLHNDANAEIIRAHSRLDTLAGAGRVEMVATLPAITAADVGRMVYVADTRSVYLAIDDAGSPAWGLMAKLPNTQGAYSREVLKDAPVAYWKLNDPVGSTTVVDSGPNALTGTVVSAPVFGSAALYPTGLPSLYFDGVDDLITVPHHVALSLTGNFTIEGWWRFTDYANYRALIDKNSSPTSGGASPFNLYANNNGNGNQDLWLNGTVVQNNSAVSANVAHHIVITRSTTGTVTWYLDGVQRTFSGPTGTLTDAGQPLRIGMRADNSPKMKGNVSDVALYNKVLTSTQVAAHYAARQ